MILVFLTQVETVQATMAQAAIPAANCQWQGTDSSAFVAPASHYPSSGMFIQAIFSR
jgi:hypothetical protein